VVAVIDQALRNPVLPFVEDGSIHESRVICSTNVIHKSDCVLRHLVAEHITEFKGLYVLRRIVFTYNIGLPEICDSVPRNFCAKSAFWRNGAKSNNMRNFFCTNQIL
jgi:hypothetical protein